jgi:HK97 gp10 family phage protein
MMTVSTVDLNRVAGRLNQLANELGENEVARVLMAGAFVLEGEAKKNVVDMKAVDTGFLLNSIHSTSTADSGYADALSKAKQRNANATMTPEYKAPKGSAAIVAGAEYAYFIEYGRSRSNARPFMRRAVEVGSGEAVEAISAAIDDVMERIFR